MYSTVYKKRLGFPIPTYWHSQSRQIGNANTWELEYPIRTNRGVMRRNRKWCTASVRAFVRQREGWRVADDDWEYAGTDKKIPLFCPNGHRSDKILSHFMCGKGCGECAGNVKLTTQYVREYIEARGWKIADDNWEYVNIDTKIPLFCPEGHRSDKKFSSFQQGHGCAECAGKSKLTTQYVREYIEARGWKIADDNWEYVNSKLKIPLFCPEGHRSDKSFSDFQQGYGCAECFYGVPTKQTINKTSNYALYCIYQYIRRHLKRQNLKLDYQEAIAYLRKHLHPQTLQIYSRTYQGCHIDHIIPASWFNLTVVKELKACFDPENLQILPAKENISKGDRLTVEEAQKFSMRLLYLLNLASNRPTGGEWDILAFKGRGFPIKLYG